MAKKSPTEKYDQAREYWLSHDDSFQAVADRFSLSVTVLSQLAQDESWAKIKADRERQIRKAKLSQAKVHETIAATTLDIVLLQLSEIREAFEESADSGKRMKSHEVLNYAKAMASLNDIATRSRGDIAEAVATLIDHGVLPQNKLPDIAMALDKGAQTAYEGLAEALNPAQHETYDVDSKNID